MNVLKKMAGLANMLLLLATQTSWAVSIDQVRVVGLFGGAAIVEINGSQGLLKVGKTRDGVKLLSATASEAVVSIDGKQHTLSLSRAHSGAYREPQAHIASIAADDRGQYQVLGSINGQSVNFLVDTGATSVAMNSVDARRLGIDFTRGQLGQASTAGGIVKSYYIVLDTVKVGEIELRNVGAAVIEGAFPQKVLLGMTYLSKVKMAEHNGLLTLSREY